MSQLKLELHENSLDNSGDGEFLGMVDEGSFESAEDYRISESAEEKKPLTPNTFLDSGEEGNPDSYSFKDLSAAVTYRFVPMTSGEETVGNQTAGSPTHVLPGGQFYVLSNPLEVEVFGQQVSGPKKAIRKEPMQAKVITKKRDDKRRATHNEVERRRRDKINSWITKLAALIPNTGMPDAASKGGILAKACDYITEMTEKQKRTEKLEVENGKLVLEVLKLNQELSELRKENSSLRSQALDINWSKKS